MQRELFMAYRAKRQFKRNSCREAVKLVTDAGIEFCTYEDLSAGGMRLLLDHAAPIGSVMEIQFTLRPAAEKALPRHEIKTLGKVVRCIQSSGDYDVGLQFLHLTPATRQAIEKAMDSEEGPF